MMNAAEKKKMLDGAKKALAEGWSIQDVKEILIDRGLTEAQASAAIKKMVRELRF